MTTSTKTHHTAAWLEDRGWSFSRRRITSAANGYTDPLNREVVVDSSLEPAAAAKTSLHEAAHVVLHASEAATFIASRDHRGRGETEAESVAYVLGGLLGLDTSAYSVGYIAGWSGGDLELVRETAGNVLSAVESIATAFSDLR